jgi:excisionase family DNA binding protein
MARPKVIDRKPIHANAADHVDAYSVDEFCERHRISPQLFYKLKPQGLMPATFKVGTRVLISREAADAWRRARENAAR